MGSKQQQSVANQKLSGVTQRHEATEPAIAWENPLIPNALLRGGQDVDGARGKELRKTAGEVEINIQRKRAQLH